MNTHDFIQECSNRGYCTKKQAEAYCRKHNKDEYTEDDLIEAYRHFQERPIGGYIPGWVQMSIHEGGGKRFHPGRPYYDQ